MGLSLGVLLAQPTDLSARPRLPPKDLRRLVVSGEVLTYGLKRPGGGVKAGKAIGVVEATPEQVLAILLDVPNYPRFLRRVKKTKVLSKGARSIRALIETDMPWPLRDAWAIVDIRHRNLGDRVYQVRWKMRRGTLKHYDGVALIEPWDAAAKKVTLSYRILAVPRTIAPDRILSQGTRHAASMVLHRVRIRAKRLFKSHRGANTGKR